MHKYYPVPLYPKRRSFRKRLKQWLVVFRVSIFLAQSRHIRCSSRPMAPSASECSHLLASVHDRPNTGIAHIWKSIKGSDYTKLVSQHGFWFTIIVFTVPRHSSVHHSSEEIARYNWWDMYTISFQYNNFYAIFNTFEPKYVASDHWLEVCFITNKSVYDVLEYVNEHWSGAWAERLIFRVSWSRAVSGKQPKNRWIGGM